jgi:hypothetical protein
MHVLLYLSCAAIPHFNYSKPLLTWATEQHPGWHILDLDNFSEPATLPFAHKLIEDASLLCLVIESELNAPTGNLTQLLRKAHTLKGKTMCIMNGEGAILQRMAQAFAPHYHHNLSLPQQQKAIENFFNQ